MRDVSSFRKALWCGAAATAILFALFASVLPPGGNYAGMLGALTAQCFMPALIAGWIGSRGRQPRGWATVAAIYVVAFLVIGGFSALGREHRTVVAAAPSAQAGNDVIVATVEGIPIAKAAVARAYRQRLALYVRAGGPGSAPISLKFLGLERGALQQLVDHQIALREARRLQIEMTPADVRARLATVPAFLENGRYIGEARAIELLARHQPWLRREAVLDEFRRDLVIERLEATVTRGLSGPERLQAYQAFLDRARSLARITVDADVLSQIVRETH
jgi:hypothetical protein